MKLLLLILLTFVFAFSSSIDEEKIQQAQALEKEWQEEKALAIYEAVLEAAPGQFEALYRAALLSSRIGNRKADSDERRRFYESAYNHAEVMLKLYPDSAPSHHAYAVAVGRKAEDAGARTRIRLSTQIREHTEKALELDPEFGPSWNLLGIWNHRAANLSRLERLAANALFGGAPEGASNENARRAFEKAISLEPDEILYYYEQAGFYNTIGDDENLRRSLEKGLSIEPRQQDDPDRLEQMLHMLNGL